MCWLVLALGVLMLLAGLVLLASFVVGRSAGEIESSGLVRVEWMILGALLASLGPLLIALGTVGAVCRGLGLR